MNKRFMKVCALFLAVMLVLCATPYVTVEAAPSATAGGYGVQPTTYSKQYNSGTRDIWCTTLSGTSASSYYTGSYTYDNLSTLSSSSLKSSLTTLMTSTHSKTSSYDDCHYKADRTDCENENGRVTLIYTSYSATMSQWNGWNREHVWPQSLGGNNTSGGGADLHHIRPSDAGVNSSRGNKKYGNAGTGASEKHGSNPAVGVLGGTYNSTYFEPLDNVKGDVARICLYVYVRWGSNWGATDITKVFQSVDVLLAWCELDPVDTWEMGRNEVVQNIQGNRNVFIDYPEYAWMIYGREVPEDMVTPSGKASGGAVGGGTATETPATSESEADTQAPAASSTGTLEAPLTTTEAYNANKSLAVGGYSDDKFYVRGTVTSIGTTGSSFYQNVNITDGKTELLIYSINLGNGISSFEVGDTITAYGYFKNYDNIIEMAGNNGDYPEIVAKGDAMGDTPTEKPTDAPVLPPVNPGDTVENTLSFASTAQRSEFTSSVQVWKQNGITLTNNKGSSTSNVADYSNPVRLYKSSSVTIECDNMTKIVFEANNASYATELVTSLSNAGVPASVSDNVVTAVFTSVTDEITFTCSAQIRLNSLTVTSVAGGSSEVPSEAPSETPMETESPSETSRPTETESPSETSRPTETETEAPSSDVMSHDEYIAAGAGETVIIEAYVQGATAYSSQYENASFFLEDKDGGYYVYRAKLTAGEFDALTPGTKVRVEGVKAVYQGEIEITNAKITVITGADRYVADPRDLTSILSNETELIKYQNTLAIFKGLTIENIEYKNGTPGGDIFVTVRQGDATYGFFVESEITAPDSEVYRMIGELQVGDSVDITGFVYWYNSINTNITDITVLGGADESESESVKETEKATESESETLKETETGPDVTVTETEAETKTETEKATETETEAVTETETATETETSGDYEFEYYYEGSSKIWTSTNAGVGESVSRISFTALESGVCSFSFKVSSAEGDILYVYLNDMCLLTAFGETEYQYCSVPLSVGDSITFEFVKDLEGDGGNDRAYVKDISVPGIIDETETDAPIETESATESATETDTSVESETAVETESEVAVETESESATDVATETESASEEATESATELESATDTEAESATELESATEVATETESVVDSETSAEGSESATEQVTETEGATSSSTETETKADGTESGGDQSNVTVTVGCSSSVAGGATVISVIFVAAYAFVRKKKED